MSPPIISPKRLNRFSLALRVSPWILLAHKMPDQINDTPVSTLSTPPNKRELPTIREVVKAYLTSTDLSQAEVARRTGKSPNYISDLLRGDRPNPSIDTLSKLADCFEIDVRKLLARQFPQD